MAAGWILNRLARPAFAAERDSAAAAKIAPEIARAMRAGGGVAGAIVLLSEQADLSGAASLATKKQKGRYVYAALREVASRTQPSVAAALAGRGLRISRLYIANALVIGGMGGAMISAAVVNNLAALPEVAQIIPNGSVSIDSLEMESTPVDSGVGIPYNVALVQAPQVWASGFTGQGLVYGNVDSGAKFDHEALVNEYRGRIGPGAYDHNYNWWDATAQRSPQPEDVIGHGTHTIGTAIGDAPDNHIGVAPGARWMACRIFVKSTTTYDVILECLQFMLAPWDLNGQNPNPDQAPDVISHSYGGNAPDSVAAPLAIAFSNLRAAGIFNAAAAGNTGPSCGSATAIPQAIPGVMSIGATDQNGKVASFSSRGPGRFAEVKEVKPDVAAPGVSVVSSVPSGGYAQMSGTSMAAPAAAGVALLVWSARPELSGDPDDTARLMELTARPMLTLGCNSVFRPNYYYGYGTVNAAAAALSKERWPIDRLKGASGPSGGAP